MVLKSEKNDEVLPNETKKLQENKDCCMEPAAMSNPLSGAYKVYIVIGDVVESRLGDETVLLDLETGIYFGIDAVGTRVWELLQDGASPEEICDTLRIEYFDAPDSLETDIIEFLGQLADNKLICVK